MMNEDGTKLSKRNKGFMCDQLRLKYVPEAVLSFLLLTGGGFRGATNEFRRLEDLIKEVANLGEFLLTNSGTRRDAIEVILCFSSTSSP